MKALAVHLILPAIAAAMIGVIPVVAQPSWVPIGPFNANYGPVTVTPDGTIFTMSTIAAELYRSTNDGQSWEVMPLRGTGTLTTDVRGWLYILNYQGVVNRSTDDGASWSALRVDSLVPESPVIAVQHAPDGEMFVTVRPSNADTVRISHSTDGGATWAHTGSMPMVFTFEGVAADASLIVSRASLILRSTDRGVSWTEVWSSLDSPPTALRRSQEGKLIMSTMERTLLASTDNGLTWAQSGRYPDTIGVVRSLAIDSTGTLWVGYADGIDPMLSSDDGASWRFVVTGFPGVPASIGVSSEAVILSTGTEGIIRSTDLGTTWEKSYIGLPGLAMDEIVQLTDTSSLAIARSGDVYIGSWQRPADWKRLWVRAYADLYHGPNASMVLVTRGTAYRSTDRGLTWKAGPEYSFSDGTAVDFDRDGTLLVGQQGIWSTADLGATWNSLDNSFTNEVDAIAVDSVGRVLTATRAGELFILDNRGGRFRKVEVGLEMGAVNDIAASPRGDILISTVSHGLRRSSDWGATWLDANQGLTSRHTRMIGVEWRGVLVTATDSGLFRSDNGGASWAEIPTSFVAGAVDLDVDRAGNVIAATPRGLYRKTQTISAAPRYDDPDDLEFAFFPNPARDRVDFTLRNSTGGRFELVIADQLGREVASLHSRAGARVLTWNCGDVPAGLYLVRGRAGHAIFQRSLVIER